MQTVGSLLPFARKLVWVKNGAALEKIVALMASKDVSQIPLLDRYQQRNFGVVRRKALWKWSLSNESTTLEDVREEPLPVVEPSYSLASALKKLDVSSALLLRGDDKKIDHLITPRVVAEAMRDYAERFQVIEQVEEQLRKYVGMIPCKDLAEAVEVESVDIEQLEFWQYHQAFSKCWEKLPLGQFDKKNTLRLIDDARDYRNSVMHFRSMESDSEGLERAQELLRLLS